MCESQNFLAPVPKAAGEFQHLATADASGQPPCWPNMCPVQASTGPEHQSAHTHMHMYKAEIDSCTNTGYTENDVQRIVTLNVNVINNQGHFPNTESQPLISVVSKLKKSLHLLLW